MEGEGKIGGDETRDSGGWICIRLMQMQLINATLRMTALRIRNNKSYDIIRIHCCVRVGKV